jgi:hypothetical protein
MYISGKYLILYVGAGIALGVLSKGDKKISLVGLGISALLGASFSFAYAFISAIEFGIGLGLAALINTHKDPE